MLLFYVRHGDPIYSPDSLTEFGHKQAEALKHRLTLAGIEEIYSSTSTRAVLTATPTAEALGLPITKLDWCHENHAWRDFNIKVFPHVPQTNEDGTPYEGKWMWAHEETVELFNSPEMRALDREWYKHPAFEGTPVKEGYARIVRETDAFLESLGYRHHSENSSYEAINPNEKRIALFAHEGFGKLFLSALLDIPYPYYSTHYEFGHSSMTVIEFSNRWQTVRARVLQHSSDSHLFAGGVSTNYQNRILF